MQSGNILSDLIAAKGVLLADGAMGTNLFDLGLQTGDSPELWNIDQPDRIGTVYQRFIDAGSDIILTNSFGGTHYRLGLHNAADRVHELNHAAASIAREKADLVDHTVIVAGSMGPTGEILEPNGPVSVEDAASAFKEQALALRDGGVDILWIETLSSTEEIHAAVSGASAAGLPIVATVSIDTNGRTMMGITAKDVIQLGSSLPGELVGVGTNCGLGAAEVVAAMCNLSTAAAEEGNTALLIAKANCGIPEYVNGKIVYNGTPEIMRNYAKLVIDAGAHIVGGCCGTSASHVAAMREALDTHQKQSPPSLETIEASLGEVSRGAQAQMRGEMGLAAGSASGRGARESRRRKKT